MSWTTAVARALDLAPLGRHHRSDGTGSYVVRDAGPLSCAVLAFQPCPRPPVVAIRGMFSGETFYACHAHQARVLGRRRWLTTAVTPAPRDPATIVDGSTRRTRVPKIGD